MPDRHDTRQRFEQWARNPACQANTLSAVHGVPMSDVAKRDGVIPTMGQSPFAIARGQNFERILFRNAGQRLLEALVKAEVLAPGAKGFADFRLKMSGSGGPLRSLEDALEGTTALLRDIAARRGGEKRRPAMIAGATIRLPGQVMLPDPVLAIDVLAVRYDETPVRLIVGEIKTYPDRGGYTDSQELATARAQAGVYVHGLHVTLSHLNLSDQLRVDDHGFLVLSRPGYNQPSVRSGEDFRFQAWRAKRGFEQLEAAARDLPPPGEQDLVASIRAAGTAYRQQCVSFCDRAQYCFSRAVEARLPIILGDDVERFLGGVPLDRAIALVEGAKPQDEAEADLRVRLGVGRT